MFFKDFEPDYRNIVTCARNKEAKRLPLYEHSISDKKMEEIINVNFVPLCRGDQKDIREYFRYVCAFYKDMGYDTVSFERCISLALPNSGALRNSSITPAIQTMEDFKKYPWEEIPDIFIKKTDKFFNALRDVLPEGMKAVGGVGNGVFEIVQNLTGYQGLCYISADDEELYKALFQKAGEISLKIWQRFMKEHGDIYCVLRFGDDLGFKSNTMLSAHDIRTLIIPQYKPIVDLVHSYNKPFLWHSCGNIFNVMDDMIDVVGIDAKHSNEDLIAPFSVWVEKYGDKIGNFGGLDVDTVCRCSSKTELKEYIEDVIVKSENHGGFAIGTGNSIPVYVPAENYINMVEIIREYRGA